MKRQHPRAPGVICAQFIQRLLGIAVGMSTIPTYAESITPPSPVRVASPTVADRHSENLCSPQFSMPSFTPPEPYLNDIVPAAPSNTPQRSFDFSSGLAGNTLLASSYAPSMLGDYFGINSSSGTPLYVGHYDGFFYGSIDQNFDPTSSQIYKGVASGVLELTNEYSNTPPKGRYQTIFINNFTTTVSTLTPQNETDYFTYSSGATELSEISNNADVQREVNRFAASIHGPGYSVPGWQEAGATSDNELFINGNDSDGFWGYDYYISIPTPGGTVAAAPGASIGRQKLSENTSPIPRDRVFVNYNYFNNTPLAAGGVDVHRVTPGFEKTFFNGRASFEMRTPFATTLDSVVALDGVTNTNNTEFGNMTMYLKALLYNNDAFAISSGLGVAVPTADDFAFTQGGTTLVKVENQSVHLLPFAAMLYTPNERFFAQAMLQMDVDANGNPVSVSGYDGTTFTGNLTQIGRPYDYTYMYLDFNVGYWTYLAPNSGRIITGFAPMFEVHVNQTVGAASATRQVVDTVPWAFTSPGSLNSVNATIGATMLIRDSATLSLGYGTPIGGIDQFDGEFRLSFNWLFGKSRPLNPLTRTNTF